MLGVRRSHRRPALSHTARRAVLAALPPGLRQQVLRRRRDSTVRTVGPESLDAELAEAARLFGRSEDEARRFLLGMQMAVPGGQPADPFSPEYRRWTWDLYRLVSGRAAYSTANEASPFDLEEAIVRPYPFATGSAAVVGDDLVARGHLVRTLALDAPARLVEFGPGWGNLTRDLATMGHHVTAVEVDERFCALLGARSAGGGRVTVVHADMLDYAADDPFDAAIFFESFHHCADHLAMLERLHGIVRPGGVVALAAEPVDHLAYPWGPRLDGLSLWSSRTYGWLELGFDERYFRRALARTGWEASFHRGPTPTCGVYIARVGRRRALG